MTSETGWVVERGHTANPEYLTTTHLGFDWTKPGGLAEALRFARKRDAERVMRVFASSSRVTEQLLR